MTHDERLVEAVAQAIHDAQGAADDLVPWDWLEDPADVFVAPDGTLENGEPGVFRWRLDMRTARAALDAIIASGTHLVLTNNEIEVAACCAGDTLREFSCSRDDYPEVRSLLAKLDAHLAEQSEKPPATPAGGS